MQPLPWDDSILLILSVSIIYQIVSEIYEIVPVSDIPPLSLAGTHRHYIVTTTTTVI